MESISSRREFVTSAGAGLLIATPGTAFGAQANSALTVGLIGAGRRGTYVSGIFAKNEFARIAAVCDIYDDQLAAASAKFTGARTFKNYKDLLASDVDAVYIATPPFLHPECFEAAVAARKHIFMEKPAGVDVAGVNRVIAAARKADKTKRISVDYQQRYGTDYRAARELVRAGELGKNCLRARGLDRRRPARPLRSSRGRGEDAQLALLSRTIRRYHRGAELPQLDVVNWFMDGHPVRVSGYGGRAVRKEIGDIMDNLACTFEYPDGTIFSYSANQYAAGGFADISETFMGSKGSLNTSRQGYSHYNKTKRGEAPVVVQSATSKGDITADAVNHFIEGARTGKLENAAFYAAESTLTAIMAREAMYRKKEMTWDELLKLG
jgi:Predicted dehydrogenases and related proteins